jgi:hypothetical protein
MQVPEGAVDQRAMVVPGVTGSAVVVAIGEDGGDPLPLGIGEMVCSPKTDPPEMGVAR